MFYININQSCCQSKIINILESVLITFFGTIPVAQSKMNSSKFLRKSHFDDFASDICIAQSETSLISKLISKYL